MDATTHQHTFLDAGPYLACSCGQAAEEDMGFDDDGNRFEGIRFLTPEEAADLEG